MNEIRSALSALKAAMARRDRRAINAIACSLIEQKLVLGDQWRAITTLLQHNGEHALAIKAATIWNEQAGDDDSVRFHLATVWARAGQVAEAQAVVGQIDANTVDFAAYHFLLGTLALNSGKKDEARTHLREAAQASPRSGQVWLALAMNGRVEENDANAIRMASNSVMLGPAIDRSAWFYALGKVEVEQGNHVEAFKSFANGAALMRAEGRYRPEQDAAAGAEIRAQWTADAVAKVANLGNSSPSPRPIFVTGLPRSGTTLVEQILVSHSRVVGGEELGLLRILEQEIGGRSVDAVAAYGRRGGTMDELRALYLRLVWERFPREGLIVDKSLNASRYLGLLGCLFPSAPIIWVRRNPLDCAWSAFRTWFLKGSNWSWSFEHIAAHFRVEDALFEHWIKIFGKRILIIEYEKLVRNPHGEIKRLMNHCGLILESNQLVPHQTRRTVTTASVAQVREPINTRAIDAAAPYVGHMGDFITAYELE